MFCPLKVTLFTYSFISIIRPGVIYILHSTVLFHLYYRKISTSLKIYYSFISIIRPGLIFLLRYFLYYIAIEVKVVTQQKYKTRSYNRDERVLSSINMKYIVKSNSCAFFNLFTHIVATPY